MSQRILTMGIILMFLANPSFADMAAGGSADVVVYHASPGGISAAIAAAREGASVRIITPYQHLGGIEANGGLVNSDQGPYPEETIGGLRKEFHQRVASYYLDTYGAGSRQVDRATKGGYPGGRFEPKVAAMIYGQMLAEYPLISPVNFGQRLISIEKTNGVIAAIICDNGSGTLIRYAGSVFIDASYTGDLLALSGASYYLGRESKYMYTEPFGGIRAGAGIGSGDSSVQSYNYRMTCTKVATNAVMVGKPDNYDDNRADYYASSKSKFAQVLSGDDIFWHTEWAELPNEKFDVNIGDMMEVNRLYSEGDRILREQIEQQQRNYSLGYLWFLQNDPLTPDAVRAQFAGLGLAKDEFQENDNFPVEIYVREARRLIGEYVLKEYDLKTTRGDKADSICLGSYVLDSHACAWIRNADGTFVLDSDGDRQREGYLGGDIEPYEIPYRSLIPRKAECENLLVPVCASVSHVAWASVRMEPVFSMMGEAAGVAAALSVKPGSAVQDVDVRTLRSKLKSYGAVVDLHPPVGGLFFSLVSKGAGLLALYDYHSYFNASGSGIGSSGLTAPVAESAPGITVSGLSRGSTSAGFTATAFGSVYWATSGTPDSENQSVGDGDYLEFTVHVNGGVAVNLTSLSFEFGGSDAQQKGTFHVTTYAQINTGSGFSTIGTHTLIVDSGAANTNVTQGVLTVDLRAPVYQRLSGDVTFRIGIFDDVNDAARYVRAQSIVLRGSVED